MYYNTVPPFLLGDDLYSSMFTMTLYVLKYHPNSYLEMTSSSMFTTMILYVLQYHPTYLEMTPSYLLTMTLYALQYHPTVTLIPKDGPSLPVHNDPVCVAISP